MQMVTRLMRHFIFTLIALLAVPIAAQEATAQAQTPAEGEQPAKQEASEIEKASASGEQVVVDKELFEKGYYEREVFNYQNHIKDYQKELRALINKNLDEKKRSIEGKYATAIEREELREAQSRIDAIALFETFLSKYPNNPKYSASALYRLAELYYENSMLEYNRRTADYERDMVRFENHEINVEPAMPQVDFSRSIKLYNELIRKFPDYTYIGVAHYMLGYCYYEIGEEDLAVKEWLVLLEKEYPTINYPELYLRLGDYYFSTNDLKSAEKYYEIGMKYRESDFFDKNLYKLAWTYYRQSRLEDAVKAFTDLLFFSDEMKNKGLDRGQDLRKEAIQYIAISFADDDWGNADKAMNYFSGIEAKETFERDVLTQLAKYFVENNKYVEAEKIYRYILGRHPYCEEAPRIHHSLIQLCNKAREFDKASQETEIFAKLYDSSAEWARINRGNATVVREAAELAKVALLDTAAFHHRQAQILKEKGQQDEAIAEYRTASGLYEDYLTKFPYTSESYDITYSYADTLYYAGDIRAAVVAYERVRDDKNQDKYRDDAAFQVFFCYNTLWEESADKQIPASEKLGKPLTTLETKLVESSDSYFVLAKEVEDKPVVAYNVARIYYDHGFYDEAEKRYLRIISEFPESQPAVMAAKDIIAAYIDKQDWVNVAKWSKILTERLSDKEKVDRKIKTEFATYRSSALFKYAQQLEEEKKHVEAATEYLRMVEENPYTPDADKAIYNAAVNYQRATMFESALKLHERIYTEYPNSELAPQSLYLVAYNAEMSYDHEKAINAYKQLYDKYPTYKEKSNAVFNAGFLLEKLQRYKEAATYYRLYYSEERSKIEGKEAMYDAGRMYQKAEDWKGAIKNYESFIATFRNDSEVSHLVARAYYQIAKIYEDKLNNWKAAKKTYNDILTYLNEKKVTSDESLLYAAEAKFKLLDDDFDAYLKLKINGKNDKQLSENLKKKVATMKELEAKYNEVPKFQVFEWTMATMYRIGYLYQSFSDALFEAEPPAGLTDEEQEIYTDMLRQQAEPIEEQAVSYYSKALEKAREDKVFNKWTQLITEKLSVMRPAEYKVGKTPMFSTDDKLNSGYMPVPTLDKAEKKVYKKAGLGNEKQETAPAKEEAAPSNGEAAPEKSEAEGENEKSE